MRPWRRLGLRLRLRERVVRRSRVRVRRRARAGMWLCVPAALFAALFVAALVMLPAPVVVNK